MKYYCFLILFLLTISCFTQDSLSYFNQQIKTALNKKDTKLSESYFQKKLTYLKNNDNLEEYLYAHFDYFLLNAKAERLTLLTNTVNSNWRSAKTNSEKTANLHLFINIAYHEKLFGNIPNAISFDEKAYHYFTTNQVRNYDIVEYCLKRLGNNYLRIGDYTKAEEVYKNTIYYLEKNALKKHLISTYLHLSNLYHKTNQVAKSNEILLKLKTKSSLTKLEKSNIYLQLATNYLTLNDSEKFKLYLNKSFKLKLNNSIITQKLLVLQADFYAKNKQFNNATKPLNAAIKLTKEIYGKNSRELAKLYLKIGNVHFYAKSHKNALAQYQLALKTLIPLFKTEENLINPLPKFIYAENTFISIFEAKAKVHKAQNNFQLSVSNLLLASHVSKKLNNKFTNQRSQIIQQTENRNRTEKIVLLYYKLYQNSLDKTYLEKAFLEIEKNKANVLNNELLSKKHNFTLENDPLLLKQKALKLQLAKLEKELIVEEYKGTNANIQYLKSTLAKKIILQSELFQLQEKINKKHPLPNEINKLTITKIQEELLIKNQLLISYFETNKKWFIFSLSKTQKLQLYVLEKNKLLETEINNYINFFFNGNDNLIKNDINAYQKTAYYLYQKLIQPVLKEPFNYLTIIPDKKLNFIAFDGLLTTETTGNNFGNFPYLVKKIAVNSSFSTTVLWLQQQQNRTNNTNKFVGYFPVFKDNERNLQHLPYTLTEQKYFENHTNSNSFLKNTATKQHFLSHFQNYDNIHLSTHASAGSLEQPAVIEFYDETLYLSEIYGLNMQNDLLVLSACETGVGKMQKGEGVMSLARGFTYAGVQNLVASLWKVNDKATSELMNNFYKNLKTNSKTTALHQAKLDYLEDHSISNFKKSPYYWSSFVFVGNVEVKVTSYTSYFVIFGLLIFLLLVYFFFRRK